MAKNIITTELTHSNGTSCTFTFCNMGGFISATVEATRAPRTLRVHLNGSDLLHVLDRMEEEATCGIAEIDEAVADLAFEMRHLLEFAKSI
jgi:hypothetical protein